MPAVESRTRVVKSPTGSPHSRTKSTDMSSVSAALRQITMVKKRP